MNYKKFVYMFLIFTAIILTIVISINCYFDVYAVFRQDKDVYYGNINYRYSKSVFVLNHKKNYNTFIFGSSRVQKMNPLILGLNSYNMGVPSGIPEDCLRDLKIFITNNVNIKNVYLGIDNFCYKLDYEKIIENLDTNPYYTDRALNSKYLIKMALQIPNIDKIKPYIKLDNNDLVKNYLTTSGQLLLAELSENNIENHIIDYVYDNKFNKPYYFSDKNAHIDYTISIIKAIKELCEKNDINLIVFFNPVHITSYLMDDINISNRFKRELVKVTDFYDFNYINFVTTNNYFWYETSHPRYFVCDWELKVITNQIDEEIPRDFGHLITQQNIDYYCNKYLKEKQEFKMPKKQYVPEHAVL